MKKYYFLNHKDSSCLETECVELKDIAAAHAEAVAYLIAVAQDNPIANFNSNEFVCILKDARGRALSRISLILQIKAL